MKIAIVSSVGQCGISEHTAMLREHLPADIRSIIDPAWLDPEAALVAADRGEEIDVLHLNYHRGLHSRWTPAVVAQVAEAFRCPVVITFHDTYERQPDALPWDLLALDCVKAMVVHEPCDLSTPSVDNPHQKDGKPYATKVHYWRQGVPERTGWQVQPVAHWDGGWRPTLGTLGFDFPWKNYDLLARVTGELGWNLRIVGQVSAERQQVLRAFNPRICFDGYTSTPYAVAALESCDATAFLYNCANSGTSAAIRLGIAAGRPLIATRGCRQFRDLELLERGPGLLWTAPSEADFRDALHTVSGCAGPRGYDMDIVHLAHRERWPVLGLQYARLYEEALR